MYFDFKHVRYVTCELINEYTLYMMSIVRVPMINYVVTPQMEGSPVFLSYHTLVSSFRSQLKTHFFKIAFPP